MLLTIISSWFGPAYYEFYDLTDVVVLIGDFTIAIELFISLCWLLSYCYYYCFCLVG